MAEKQTLVIFGDRLTRRHVIALVGTSVLLIMLTLGASLSDPTLIVAAPMGMVLAAVAVWNPFALYVIMLCMLSLVPVESRMFTLYVPNWLQMVVPMLLLATLLYNLMRPRRKAFAANWADVFVLGFIFIGYAGVFLEKGPATWKFFTNQQVVPALMYFVVKWLPLDWHRFRLQLHLQLLSVMALAAIMLGRVLTGFDPFYHNFSFLGLGGEARGPMWSIADTVAYTGIWPLFFIYAGVTNLRAVGRPPRWLWAAGFVMILLATAATTERTGPAAIAVGFALAMLSRRMAKWVLVCALAVPLLIPLWLVTPMGQQAAERMTTLKEKGAGFERQVYRDKALRYTRTPLWNPLWGSGFGRINQLAAVTLPQDQWFFDYNWGEFCPLQDFATRPTHCAPVTIFSEYGYGGVVTLLGVAVMVGAGLVRARRLVRREGYAVDGPLIVAALGALAGVVVNGIFHNTEAVVEVLILVWSFAGTVIGHPEIFALNPVPAVQRPSSGTASSAT